MNTDNIKKLIEAFYNGETTAEEEQILKDYFNGDNIAEELEEEKDIFVQLYDAKPIEVPSTLKPRLENLIDDLAAQEKEEVVISEPKQSKRHLMRWIGSIAAGVAILISAGIYFKGKSNINPSINEYTQMKDTYSDPEEAYKEAQKALALVSSNFNKGVSQVNVVSESLDKTNEILNKTFNRKNNKES